MNVKKRNLLKNQKGFTLVELIVVIVIIGILAAIVIPRLAGFRESATIKADIATAKTLATAAESVYSEDPAGFLAADVTSAAGSKILDYLPTSFSWKTQLDTADTFVVTVDTAAATAGDVTVTGANGSQVYPEPKGDYTPNDATD